MPRLLGTLARSSLPHLSKLGLDFAQPSRSVLLPLVDCIRAHHTVRSLSLLFDLPPTIAPVLLDTLCHYNILQALDIRLRITPSDPSPLDLLADGCPALTKLNLALLDTETMGSQELPFKDVRALLRCTTLEHLDLYCTLPVAVRPDDATAMGNAWPRLHTLLLHCPGAPDLARGTHVSVLKFLASALGSSLRQLGLSLTFQGPIPGADTPLQRFSRLQFLFIRGRLGSEVQSAAVGEFLGAICPQTVTVHYAGGRFSNPVWFHRRLSDATEARNWRDEWARTLMYMGVVQRAQLGRDRYHEERQALAPTA